MIDWGVWVKQNRIALIAGFVCLLIGLGGGTYLAPHFYHLPIVQEERELNNPYHFISPLLSCSTDENLNSNQAAYLQEQFQNAITAEEDAGDITIASVYFHDLNRGPFVSVNPDQTFSPGSLLKLPLAISLYKQAEGDPTILQKMLSLTNTETSDPQFFKPTSILPPGSYTTEQLIDQMLEQSDNNAAQVLANFDGVSSFQQTYLELGVPTPPVEGDDYTLTAHDYGTFFTILYDATYLDANDSEHVLSLLSKSTFTSGLVAGVPAGIDVSHKFGERSYAGTSQNELHDCGIIYAPNHPYLLCVMTQGTNYTNMAKTIADLSNIAYNYVE